MQPPQTPIPPWASNPRRQMPPSMLSPSFSRSAFPASSTAGGAGGGDHDAAVSEHPCVTLFEWWLARVEGDDQKIAVAGVFERNQTVLEFAPAPIAKRHEACVLETEDGIVLHIYGSLNISRMRNNGYSSKVCEKFLIGFPHWWQSCNQLYPKVMSNSEVDLTQFYLEKFQQGERLHSYGSSLFSKLVNSVKSCSRKNSVKSFSHNDAAFQKSSYLSNGAPRFDEYTCDGDIATNENAAATNDHGERHEAVCNEADNVEIHLAAGRALRERDDGDVDTNASLVLTVECANDAGNEEADDGAPTSTCDQRIPVASLRSQVCWRKARRVALSKKAVVNEDMPTSVCLDLQNSSYLSNGTRFEEYTCDGDIATNENAAASNDDGERDEAVCNEVDNMEIDLTAGIALRERDDGDIDTNASLVLMVECANDAGNEEADKAPLTSNQITPVASPKSQVCWKKAQRVAMSNKAAVNEDMPTSGCLDVQNSSYLSYGTPRFEECTHIGDIPTNGKAAALNDDREIYAALSKEVDDVEIEFTAGSALCESGHADIETNVSLAFTSECANDVGNEEADKAPLTSTCYQRTSVVSLKTQGCQEKTQHVALSEKAAVDEEMPTSVCLDSQNSSYLSNETPRFEKNTCVGDIPTNEVAAPLNDNSERCTAISEEVNSVEIGLIVGSTIRERGHDDITTNVSLALTVECTNDAVSEGVDNTSLLGCKKTPVASLKSQGCQEKHQQIPSNEKPSGLPKKQRSALEKWQGATRSPLTSPVPYAHESPLTRGRASSLSMSTPEALKLRKTRSGRVVVPILDAGCQRIVYDVDGTITGVIGLDSPASAKGSKLKTYARKKRRAALDSAPLAKESKLKTCARKKRRAE